MSDNYTEEQKKIKKKKDFIKGLPVYIITCLFLFFINIITNPSHLWFLYPTLGWGMAVAFQYFDAFGSEKLERAFMKEEGKDEDLIERLKQIGGEKITIFDTKPTKKNKEKEIIIEEDYDDEEGYV